jgi:nucleotide-binding universal stress UspA family protein
MIASDWAMNRAFESHVFRRAPFGAQQRRILCATDLSARSARALRAAAALANRLDAQLTVLHVVPTRAPVTDRDLAHERLRDHLSASRQAPDAIPVLAVRYGDTAKTIAEVAVETHADLIVMGIQSKRAFASLTGTTAERVIAAARCPVLIIRSNGTLRYGGVVVAADLNPSFEEMLRFAHRWSFLDRGPVAIVHGFQSPYHGPIYAEGYDVAAAREQTARWRKSARAHLLAKVSAVGLDASRFDVRVEEQRPLRVVRRALRRRTPSLLILGGSEHTFMSRLFRGSLTNDALLSLDCDVLICGTSSPRAVLH